MLITAKVGDLTKVKKYDAIVNAANGIGVMGAGVARAIAKAMGEDLLPEVRLIAMKDGRPHSEGQVYLTPPGKLAKNKVLGILHAVTMKYPGSPTTYGIVDQCLHTVFNRTVEEGFTSVAIPGLGTGIGNLDPAIVGRRTVEIGRKYADQINILVVDIDGYFIEAVKEAIGAG